MGNSVSQHSQLIKDNSGALIIATCAIVGGIYTTRQQNYYKSKYKLKYSERKVIFNLTKKLVFRIK